MQHLNKNTTCESVRRFRKAAHKVVNFYLTPIFCLLEFITIQQMTH